MNLVDWLSESVVDQPHLRLVGYEVPSPDILTREGRYKNVVCTELKDSFLSSKQPVQKIFFQMYGKTV